MLKQKRDAKQMGKSSAKLLPKSTAASAATHPDLEESKVQIALPQTAKDRFAQREEAYIRQEFDRHQEKMLRDVQYERDSKARKEKYFFVDKSSQSMMKRDLIRQPQLKPVHQCTSSDNRTFQTVEWDQDMIRLALCVMAAMGVSAAILQE